MEQNIKEIPQELKDLFKQYLKENLKFEIDIDRSYYQSEGVYINIKLFVDNEVISENTKLI